MAKLMRELVEVLGGFKPTVQLPRDFFDENENRHFIENYIPTSETLDIFLDIRDSLQQNSINRARIFIGTYGTGKSDLMLLIANYVTRQPDDSLLEPFFKRLRLLDKNKGDAIYNARLNKPPFLLVLLQADTAITFNSFILDGLSTSLEKANLKDLMGNTYYKAAIELIDDWQHNHQENITKLNRVLERDYNQTITSLKHDLSGSYADSALEIFREAVQTAVGMPFYPTAVIQRSSDAFEEVVKKITANKQYSGLFIIVDEFTHLLKNFATNSTAAGIKGIDNLAELATRSGPNQIHFYVVSLEPFASALNTSKESQKELERSGGRFNKQIELKSQNTEELISVAIAKLVSPEKLFASATAQQDELLNLARKIWPQDYNNEWLKTTVVQGCFPLHPLTTYCLPLLNRELAQNERTMFSFIWDREKGLNHFIQNASADPTSDNWLPLLTLDQLFYYFEQNIKEKRPDLLQVYKGAANTDLQPDQLSTGLEGQLLRTLVLLDVVTGYSALRANLELLTSALSLPQSSKSIVESALVSLQNAGITYPTQSGYFQLVKPGRANHLEMRRKIFQKANDFIGSPIEKLNSKFSPPDIRTEKYNEEHGTERKLIARFVSPDTLQNSTSALQNLSSVDGLLWYVIPTTENDLLSARNEALKLTRLNKQLLIAVPRQTSELIMQFQRKDALEIFRNSSEYQSSEYQDLLADTGLVGKDINQGFQEALNIFNKPSNLEWYYSGNTKTVTNSSHLDLIASTMMKEVFPNTPSHKTPQHLKSSGRSTNVKAALDELITSPFKINTSKKPSAKEAVLLSGAKPIGLIKAIGENAGYTSFAVCIPDSYKNKNSFEIWEKIETALRANQSLDKIVGDLSKPPFGLYNSVLQLFLAAFYNINRDYLEFYENKTLNRPLDVTSDLIVKIGESPSNYTIRYTPLETNQIKFLNSILSGLYPNQGIPTAGGHTETLTKRVSKSLRNWITAAPKILIMSSKEQLALIMPSTTSDVIDTLVKLRDVAILPNPEDTERALLTHLPQDLGLSSENNTWSTEQLENLSNRILVTNKQLNGFEKYFRYLIASRIGQIFSPDSGPLNFSDVLKAAFAWRKSIANVRKDGYGNLSNEYQLLYLLDNDPVDFEQVFLNGLPSRWKLGLLKEWESLEKLDNYIELLVQTKKSIEEKEVFLEEKAKEARQKIDTVSFSAKQISESREGIPETNTTTNPPIPDLQYGTQTNTFVTTSSKTEAAVISTSGKDNVTNGSPATTNSSIVDPKPIQKPNKNSNDINTSNDAEIEHIYLQLAAILDHAKGNQRVPIIQKLIDRYRHK